MAAYYFPDYHPDARNAAWHGRDWTEWELVRRAEPRFPGHQQPKVPLWGYEDESKPSVMARKIDVAADHGLDAFIFDWYWYEDGPYLQRCLEEGFLQADNNSRLKFAIMWANHDLIDIHPAIRNRPYNVLKSGAVSEQAFIAATDQMINCYFNHPSYWRVQGGLYFSVYELMRLVRGLGGVAPARRAFDDFRRRVELAGLGRLHLNAVVWGIEILPGEDQIGDPNDLLARLGFDSATSYVWIHHQPLADFPATAYAGYRERNIRDFDRFSRTFALPYFPNVTMGWDSSPRTIQSDAFEPLGYPYMATLSGNSPAEFETALLQARAFLDGVPADKRILTINAWNEWTEGSYLEPDQINGMGYLEAIKRVFRP